MGSQTGSDKRPVISAEIINAGENPTLEMTVNGQKVNAVYAGGKLTYTPAADMNAPATPGGETPDISFCPEIDRYTVLQGETAADVQLKKDVNRHTLETANPDVNLDALQAGQVLCVPENQACPPGNTYTLDKDETMETTALLLNVSLSALLRANPCLAPSDFKQGACINIPED